MPGSPPAGGSPPAADSPPPADRPGTPYMPYMPSMPPGIIICGMYGIASWGMRPAAAAACTCACVASRGAPAASWATWAARGRT